MVPGFFTDLWPGDSDSGVGVGLWALIVLFYLVGYLTIIFFKAAPTSAASIRPEGGGRSRAPRRPVRDTTLSIG